MESRASGARDLAARAIANAEAEARLAKFRSLVRNLDATPREKRVYARDIADLNPEQQALVVAKLKRERRDGDGGGEQFQRLFSEVKQRLSQEVRAFEQDLTINRVSGTNGASTREAEARNEELLAKRDAARDLALLNPEEMVRKFFRRNRARRVAIRAGQRQRRRAADEARANEKLMERARKIFADGIAARSSGGLDSPEASQEALRVRQADVGALPDLDSRRLATEVARMSRARRLAVLLDLRKRNREHAANAPGQRKKLRMDGEVAIMGGAGASGDVDSAEARQEAVMDGTGTSSMPDFAEARQEELPPTREHAPDRALAETNHPREINQEAPWRDGEVHVEKALMDGEGTGFLGSAEARQEELPLNGEHAHSRALAETDHPREIKQEAPWRDGVLHVETALMDGEGTGFLGSVEARQAELPSNGEHAHARALAETEHPLEVKVEVSWTDEAVRVEEPLMDGVGTGDLGSAEARQEELPSNGEHAHARALTEADHPPKFEGGDAWRDDEVRVEKPFMDGVGTGDLGSAEARQEEHPSNREHVHARTLAATDHPPKSEGGNCGVGLKKALADGVGTGEVGRNAAIAEGAGAGGFAFAEARLDELRAKAVAELAGRVAANAVRHPDGRVLGVWAEEVGRNAAMGGAGPGRFALTEARLEELRANAIAKVAEKVVRDGELKARAGALVAGAGRDRVSRNEAVVEGTGNDGLAFIEARLEKLRAKAVAEMAGRFAGNVEVQPGVRAPANGIGTGEINHNSAVVGGTGARGFPFVAANIEEFRTQAVAEAAGGVTWDAAEFNRDAGLAQDRHAEELRTRGKTLVDGIGTGEVDGNATVVDGTGAGGFPFLEPKHEQLGTEAVAEVAGRVARDAAEVQRKADLAQARQADGQAHMGGIGTGETGRKAAFVAGAGAGGFPFLEARLEELRTRAVELVERPGRSERDAVTEEGGGVSVQEDVQREVYAEAEPLANFGNRYAAACATVFPPPGPESFVLAGSGDAGLNAQQPAQELQALALPVPWAARGKVSAENARDTDEQGRADHKLAEARAARQREKERLRSAARRESVRFTDPHWRENERRKLARKTGEAEREKDRLRAAARREAGRCHLAEEDKKERKKNSQKHRADAEIELRGQVLRERRRVQQQVRRQHLREAAAQATAAAVAAEREKRDATSLEPNCEPDTNTQVGAQLQGLQQQQLGICTPQAPVDAGRERARLRAQWEIDYQRRRESASQRRAEARRERDRLRAAARRKAQRVANDKEARALQQATRERRRLQQAARRQSQREAVEAAAPEKDDALKASGPEHPLHQTECAMQEIANTEEAVIEEGSEGLAMVDGGGGVSASGGASGGGGSAGGATAGLGIVSAYDFTEQAARSESSVPEADAAVAKNAVPVVLLADKRGSIIGSDPKLPNRSF